MATTPRSATCGNCTLKLVTIAYRRAPWFRIVREPLKAGMRLLVRLHHIDAGEYAVATPACGNCIRFYKTSLKEKSATFRWLHRWVNPAFDRVLETIVTGRELDQSRSYARSASKGELSEDEVSRWMRGMKTGF